MIERIILKWGNYYFYYFVRGREGGRAEKGEACILEGG
jgi:hypothetical protein